jgi:hypothetical protein
MIAALALAADLRTLTLSDWSEARVRGDTGQPIAFDLTTAPNATLALATPRWHLSLAYQPYLGVTDLESTSPGAIYLNTASLNVGWHNRTVALGLTETGSYGIQNTSQLLIQAPAAGMQQTVSSGVPISNIEYAGSITNATLVYTPSPYWQLALRGGFFANGGVRAVDQQSIAFQHGPTAEVTLTHTVSREDAVFFRANGVRTETVPAPCFGLEGITTGDCQPDSYIGTAVAGLRRAFSPTTVGSFGVGAGVIRARIGPQFLYQTTPFPVVTASYEYTFIRDEHRVVFRADANVSPFIDTRDGAVDDRAQLTGTGTWTLGKLSLTGSFGAATTLVVVEIEPSTILFATSRLDDHLTKNLMVSFGLSYFWESQEGADVISSAIASLSMTVTTLPWRF